MTEQRPEQASDGSPRPDGDNLHVTPAVPGPSGSGEQADRGGDEDARSVGEGADGGQQ
jgi:hypothetical protein